MVKPAIPNIRQWFQKWGVEQDGPQRRQGISVSIFQKGFTPKGLWGLDYLQNGGTEENCELLILMPVYLISPNFRKICHILNNCFLLCAHINGIKWIISFFLRLSVTNHHRLCDHSFPTLITSCLSSCGCMWGNHTLSTVEESMLKVHRKTIIQNFIIMNLLSLQYTYIHVCTINTVIFTYSYIYGLNI